MLMVELSNPDEANRPSKSDPNNPLLLPSNIIRHSRSPATGPNPSSSQPNLGQTPPPVRYSPSPVHHPDLVQTPIRSDSFLPLQDISNLSSHEPKRFSTRKDGRTKQSTTEGVVSVPVNARYEDIKWRRQLGKSKSISTKRISPRFAQQPNVTLLSLLT